MPIAPPVRPPPRRWKQRIRSLAIEVGIALVIVFAVGWYRTRDAAHGPAPELPATAINTEVTLASLRGEPALVYFWATWCGVCKTMQGTMEGLARDHRVVTIASQSGDRGAIEKYLAEQGLAYPTLLDDGGAAARRWGVGAYPAIFVLDREGRVRFVELGWTSSFGLRIRLWLAGF